MTKTTARWMTAETLGAIILWCLLMAAVGVTPLIVSSRAFDPFRLPKAAFFEGLMLLVLGGGIAWGIFFGTLVRQRTARSHIPIAISAAAVAWTAIASMTARQPELARGAPLTAVAFAVLFVATLVFSRGTILPLAAMFLPAIANAIFATLQALHVWSPITLEKIPPGRNYAMGLLGNPDYVGTFLLLPSVVAVGGVLAFPKYRLPFAAIAVVLLSGLFFAQSVTATGTMVIALLSFGVVIPSTKVRVGIMCVVAIVGLATLAYAPTRSRAVELVTHYREGRLNDAFSARLPAYIVALDMFRERPVTGVGPGGFEAQYMSYKIKVDERFPSLRRQRNENFGETHNDHLQLLAETGLPGYLLFLSALLHFGALSFRTSPSNDSRSEFARLISFPSALAFAVAAVAQFPLYLTPTLATSLFIAALAHRWRLDADA